MRQDFCGWSALGPISLFIENIIGLHTVDAQEKRIEWRLHHDCRHGIKNLRFGDIETSLIAEDERHVTVISNKPYTLAINGEEFEIVPGEHEIRLGEDG